ncbi:FAD-dependent oxidoreductase [Streptomyces sp. S07_1.15]|uniref:NAD(P)/FAD-dependent oxidoreductase n=1 Tax=Streptomyces sp. S07_1.15 TaxID=2873925 RepID=UPI001D15BF99|nr:FAD-dependent oxidoreductase [Streptomyces sp. S07_1.15]MCC3652464.1 FAD-dependent oxidoreductase [Streptomyces sp. S07_1.15]
MPQQHPARPGDHETTAGPAPEPGRPGDRPSGRPADHRIVVIGAGYSGLLAALRLAPHHKVTLVDPADHFTERVRLHQLAAAGTEVTHPLSRFLARRPGIAHVASRATALDTGNRLVHTDDGRALPYDRLVYALGSRTDTRGGALGTGDRAYTAETAAELRKRLDDGRGALTVVGGGLTGIETAAELAGSRPDWEIRLLTSGEPGAGLSRKGRAHVRAFLRDHGVRVEEGRRVATADEVDADAVFWATSMTPRTEIAERAGLDLDPAGRIRVDPALRSLSHPEIYAVGDAAAASTPGSGPLRMACATAVPTGLHAAGAIAAELRGREQRPLSFRYALQCVSLGRDDGLIQSVHRDDSPRERALTGRPAALLKEQVVRSTVHALSLAARHPAALRLLPGSG